MLLAGVLGESYAQGLAPGSNPVSGENFWIFFPASLPTEGTKSQRKEHNQQL